MRLKHPFSFFLMMLVIVITAALSVSWATIHIFALVVDIGLLIGLRSLCHWETHKSLPGVRT